EILREGQQERLRRGRLRDDDTYPTLRGLAGLLQPGPVLPVVLLPGVLLACVLLPGFFLPGLLPAQARAGHRSHKIATRWARRPILRERLVGRATQIGRAHVCT